MHVTLLLVTAQAQGLGGMSDLFSTYETDFQLAIQEAQSKLQSNSGQQGARAIQGALDEASEIIDQMNIEVQNMPASSRSSFNAKIRQYRGEVEQSKRQLTEVMEQENRHQLFGGSAGYRDDVDDQDGVHDQQRKKLLQNNASLERSSERLRESQRIANETESIGGNILNDLRAQREQILNLRNTLLAADNYVDKSIRTLNSMSRRITANKFISYAIIGVLILLIFLVLASKFW